MRRSPATVVILAGSVPAPVLDAVGHSVPLIRPADDSAEAALDALRRASGVSAPYVLVHADPLDPVAAQWHAMWDLGDTDRDPARFEVAAGAALASWRAGTFELPDYYLVAGAAVPDPDFYLGPLRSSRPNRVAVAIAGEPAELAAEIVHVLASLRHGPWWPPLDQIVAAARDFYPGSLAEAPA
jgi:hypothetical protein